MFQDIVAKLLSLSQQRPRALCILSGTGTVTSVTLRQAASSNPGLTYEVKALITSHDFKCLRLFLWFPKKLIYLFTFLQGKFEILCLSGSYLVAEDVGPSNRTGGISVSLSTRDGHVIGGGVAVLIAGGPVQVYS